MNIHNTIIELGLLMLKIKVKVEKIFKYNSRFK